MEQIWKDIEVPLLQSLVRDSGEKHSVLTFRMITRAQHQAVIDSNEGADAIYRELVKLAAGLSESEVQKLVAPDYNSIVALTDDAYGQGSEYWFEKLEWQRLSPSDRKAAESGYGLHTRLPLLLPVDTVTEGKIDVITLQFPTVGALDKMHQLPDDQHEDFITMHITGLGADELGNLSVPDGKSLTLRVNDFLSQTGSFFSAKATSKS